MSASPDAARRDFAFTGIDIHSLMPYYPCILFYKIHGG
jgi:hypothetical protein